MEIKIRLKEKVSDSDLLSLSEKIYKISREQNAGEMYLTVHFVDGTSVKDMWDGPTIKANPKIKKIDKYLSANEFSIDSIGIGFSNDNLSIFYGPFKEDFGKEGEKGLSATLIKEKPSYHLKVSMWQFNTQNLRFVVEVNEILDRYVKPAAKPDEDNLSIATWLLAYYKEIDEIRAKAELSKKEELKKIKEDLDERQEYLEFKEASIGNREARRSLQKRLTEQITSNLKLFTLSQETNSKRKVTFWTFVIFLLLLISFSVYNFYISAQTITSGKTGILLWYSLIKASVGVIGIVVFGLYFLRWNDDWARRHADEEFRLKRLALDINRASWVVELVSEWKESNWHEERRRNKDFWEEEARRKKEYLEELRVVDHLREHNNQQSDSTENDHLKNVISSVVLAPVSPVANISSEFPKELLDKLAYGLFANQDNIVQANVEGLASNTRSENNEAANSLDALLGAASNVSIKLPSDVQLTLDRKGVGMLKKEVEKRKAVTEKSKEKIKTKRKDAEKESSE